MPSPTVPHRVQPGAEHPLPQGEQGCWWLRGSCCTRARGAGPACPWQPFPFARPWQRVQNAAGMAVLKEVGEDNPNIGTGHPVPPTSAWLRQMLLPSPGSQGMPRGWARPWEGGPKVSCHPHCQPRVLSVLVTIGYMWPQPPQIPPVTHKSWELGWPQYPGMAAVSQR